MPDVLPVGQNVLEAVKVGLAILEQASAKVVYWHLSQCNRRKMSNQGQQVLEAFTLCTDWVFSDRNRRKTSSQLGRRS